MVACPLTCHLRRSRVFLRQRIGVAADAATRAECHVNGHGTTTRRRVDSVQCVFLHLLTSRRAAKRTLYPRGRKWRKHEAVGFDSLG